MMTNPHININTGTCMVPLDTGPIAIISSPPPQWKLLLLILEWLVRITLHYTNRRAEASCSHADPHRLNRSGLCEAFSAFPAG
jgi:hypothetical protein